jgi:hypothetical protein
MVQGLSQVFSITLYVLWKSFFMLYGEEVVLMVSFLMILTELAWRLIQYFVRSYGWSIAFSVCITSQFHSFIMLFQAFICLRDNLTVVLLISSEHPGSRQSPSEFVIPVAKYCKAINTQVDVGMRFRMVFETEESSVRRWAPVKEVRILQLISIKVFLSNTSLIACLQFILTVPETFVLKLQIHGHYYWDWGPWSHQVAEIRLALSQGMSNWNQLKLCENVCVALSAL